MADETTTIEIEVRAKDLSKNVLKGMGSNAKRAGNVATRAFAKVGLAAVRAAAGIGRMARGIARGLTRAVTGLLGPLAALAGAGGIMFAVKSASDFRKKMAEVSTLLIGTGTNMDELRKQTIDMAQELGQNEIEVAAGLYESLSAGVGTAAESLFFLKQATKLAVGGVATTKEAVDALTTVMNAWGKENFDVERSADILFKTVEGGKITISGLARNLGVVASSAANLGVPLEEVSAIIATLTATTNRVAESFTGTQAIMNSFAKASPQIRSAFRNIGIDISSTAIKTGGLVRVIEQLADAGLSPEDIAKLFPEIEASKAIQAMIGNIGKLTDSLEGARNAAGIAGDAFLRVFEDPAVRVSRLINSIRIEFVKMGETILLAVDDAIESSGGIEAVTGNFQILATVLGEVAKIGVGFFGELAGNLNSFVSRVGAEEVASLMVGAINAVIGLAKAGFLIIKDLVKGLVNALQLLPGVIKQVMSMLPFGPDAPAGDPLGDLGSAFQISDDVWDQNFKNMETLKDFWAELKQSVVRYNTELDQTAQGPIGLNGEVPTARAQGPIYQGPSETVVTATRSFFDIVKQGAKEFSILGESAEAFTLNLGGQLGNGAFEMTRGFFRDVISGAKSAGEAFKDLAANFVAMIVDMIAQVLAFQAVKSVFGMVGMGGLMGFAKGGVVPMAHAAQGMVVGPGIHMTGGGPVEVGDNPERSEVILPLRHGPRGLGVESFGGAQSNQVTFNASFTSIDPRGAAEVILKAMPQIEQKLTYALTSGSNAELIRAVGGA